MGEEKTQMSEPFDVTYLVVPVEDAATAFNEVDAVTKVLLTRGIFMKSMEKYVVLVWDSRMKSGELDDNEANILLNTIQSRGWKRYLLINQGCTQEGCYASVASGSQAQEIIKDVGFVISFNITAAVYSPSEKE